MTSEVGLRRITKADSRLREMMRDHYSQPGGFVGRQLIYAVEVHGVMIGAIAAGSATRFLPGRESFFGRLPLNNLVNNTFYHVVQPQEGYPRRNFTTLVVRLWRERVARDWAEKYGDDVLAFETLVEKPRSGELYRRDGWTLVGETKGFTCKRTAGKGTDSWTGKRVWDTKNLRPKRVFVRDAL